MSSSTNWTFAVRSLRSPNYRLFFGGQSLSLIGTWMTRIATSWLVYRLTNSALLLGLVGFAGQVPAFFLTPLAGVWIDRWDRHRTLIVTQVLSMLQSLVLAALTFTGHMQIATFIGLILFQGIINSFDMPARQSFLVEMIEDKKDLSNAIAMNSSMVNSARLVGPAIAGLVISAVGEAYCFLIDGISYIAVIASLLAMKGIRARAVGEHKSVVQEMREGWNYVFSSPAIRWILILLAIVNLAGAPYSVLMPIVAGGILKGGPHTLGFLMAASGVGALISAISLAIRKTVIGLGKMIAISTVLFGASLVLLGVSHWVWLSMVVMLGAGFGLMQQMAASNTILQTIVEDNKRGRVMAFYTMAVLGITPFGSLLAGSFANRFGAPATLVYGGLICLGGGIWFARQLPELRRVIRPVYVQLGIIPELASGVQSASALPMPPQG